MKISFLSVFPPYRGGISKNSSLIYKALIKSHKVQAINFKKLYPDLLFPGKSQYDINQQEIGSRLLNSTNFFSWIKSVKKIKDFKPEVLIFKFWHPFFAPCYRYIINKVKNKNQCKVIMICDNIFPHEGFPFSKKIIKSLVSKVDGFIVQSWSVEKELKSVVRKPVFKKVFHPIYDNYPKEISREQAREKIAISESKVILFFGLIRSYKGLDDLIRSINPLFDVDDDVKLLIAGECYEDKNKYYDLINNSKHKNKILWIEEFIHDNEVNIYFSAADVVVLPYKTASQSGVIPLSYHYNKPIITSDLEGLTEVVQDGKTGFIYNQSNIKSLGLKILEFFNDYRPDQYKQNIVDYKKRFSWEAFNSAIEEINTTLNDEK